MEEELFEELLESVKEAGSVLRGEREAARSTRYDDADNAPGEGRIRPGNNDLMTPTAPEKAYVVPQAPSKDERPLARVS